MNCERTLTTQGPVSCMCIDKVNGCIVAAVDYIIKSVVFQFLQWLDLVSFYVKCRFNSYV